MKKPVDERAERKAKLFFSENEQAIKDYAGRAGLIFEAGEKWTLDLHGGKGTFDPRFFVKRGFSVSECMWATCHEIEHFLDWRRDPEAYGELMERTEKQRRLALLYHFINDVLVNLEEDRRFPAHRETREYLYEDKLFPRTDYLKAPRHLQFIYALLRERTLPGEELVLSGEVRSLISRLRNIDGQGTDLLSLVADPSAAPRDRFELIRDYIEPLYENLFVLDLEERKKEADQEKGGKSDLLEDESVEGGGRRSYQGHIETDVLEEEAYFSPEYEAAEERLLQTLTPREAREEIEREVMRRREEIRSPEEIAREQFTSQHGVSVEEAEDYGDDYRKIEYQIKPLREIFDRIISTRKQVRRRLKERTDQGVILDPSLIAQAYVDAWSGVPNSRTQLKVRREEFDEHRLREVEFTVICDLSGSMNENRPGGKSYEQRLSVILLTEALDEFEKKLRSERLDHSVDLSVLTEVRGFHAEDVQLKPLTDSIDFATRVAISRRLETCTGGNTADHKPLVRVLAGIDARRTKKIESGILKKVLILITDGGSDDASLTREAKSRLAAAGVLARAIQIGKPGRKDVEKFRNIWQKDGFPCRDVSRLTSTMEKLLEGFLAEL